MFHILYVDDEPELLEIGKIFLEADGELQVDTRTSTAAAVSLLTSSAYDAIISDYQMPGMNGIEFLKAVRASHNPIPFILFTGRGREEVVIQALNEGADFYLQKGGEPESQFAELSNKIRYAINSRRADAILREKTAELDQFFNNSLDLLCIADRRGIIHRVNPEWERALGYPLSDLEGKKITEFIHPDDLEPTIRAVSPERDTPEILNFQNRFRHRDGTYRWLEWRTYIHGTFLYAAARDVTDRRNAADALKESEEKYRRIVETSIEGIWSIDADFVTVFINRKMADMLGYAPDEMIGKTIMEFMDPADLADNEIKRKNRQRGISEFYERKLRRMDGSFRWFGISVTALKDPSGTYAGSFAMMTDITDRKTAEEELIRKNQELGAAYEQLTASEEELRQNLEELASSQQDLKKSEEKYRRFVETSIEGIWSMNAGFGTVYVNRRMADMLGYTIEEMLGRPIMDFMDPGELADNDRKMEERKKGLNDFYERRFRRKDDTLRWFSVSVTAMRDASGAFAGSFAMLTDITDRKTAEDELIRKNQELGAAYEQLTASEEELRQNLEELASSQRDLKESEEKYRDLFDNAILGIFRTTPAGKYLNINWAFARIMGFSSPEEMIASTHDIGKQLYTRPEDREKFRALLATDGEVQNFETEVRHTDGSTIWIAINARAFKDPQGTILWYNGTIENITSRKKAEFELARKNEDLLSSYEEITASEEELRQNLEELTRKEQDLRQKSGELEDRNELISTLLDTLPIGIFMVEAPSGKPIMANREAAKLLGRGILPDATEHNLSEVYEAYRLGTIEKYPSQEMPIVRGMRGESSYVDDMVVVRPDGTRVWLEVFGNPVRDAGGNIVASLVCFIDISGRKKADESLRQANRKLNLLSSVTRHDITNQVTSLKSYLALIRKKETDPSLAEYLRRVTDIVQRIDILIRFTKEYENIGVSAPVWQNARELFESASGQIRANPGILKNEIPADIEIFSDPLTVKVFYNLVDNALRYGGTVSAIRFSVEQNNGDCILVCEDDGQGIPDTDKEIIFERGYGKNTGLGLALCREILDITGITIRETGQPGRGARFEMTVPRGQYRIVSSS